MAFTSNPYELFAFNCQVVKSSARDWWAVHKEIPFRMLTTATCAGLCRIVDHW